MDHAYKGNKSNVRTGESQILKCTSQAAVLYGVSNRRTICRQFGVQVDRGAARLASAHAGALQDIKCILALREEQTIILAGDRNTKKMMKLAHVHHSKLTL